MGKRRIGLARLKAMIESNPNTFVLEGEQTPTPPSGGGSQAEAGAILVGHTPDRDVGDFFFGN